MTTYCALPWNHLATHPDGAVSLCCRVDFNEGIGMSFDKQVGANRLFYNLNFDKIEKIINSDSFKEVRLKMLKSERPLPCLSCFKEEDLGLVSKRMRENSIFDVEIADLKLKTSDSGEISPNIEYAELRLGNLCNLKCRTCNPNSSSKWSAEYGTTQDSLDFIKKYDLKANFKWAETEVFWADFLANTQQLKQLYINGGEPTLIKQHWLYLQKLIDLNLSKNINIKYNINMTYLPQNAFAIWRQFKSVYIGASVDDLNERNTYIRHGANWEEILKNLKLIHDAGFAIAIEQTVSVYNVFYLDEMELLCKNNKLGYGLNFVYDPDYLAIGCIPDRVKKIILSKLKNKISDNLFKDISAHMSAKENLELWEKFKMYNQFLDKNRNENFKDSFSEYTNILSSEGFL